MRFVCDSCRAQYMISDEKVGAKGVKVRCKKCGFVILVRRGQEGASAKAEPPADNEGQTQIASAGDMAAQANGAGGGNNNIFGGVDDDELGAVFDQALGTSSPAASSSTNDLISRSMGDSGPGPDDSDSTRVMDAAAMKKLAQIAQDEPSEPDAKPAAQDWFVAIDEKQSGPFGVERIKDLWNRGEIGPDSLAWRAGLADWQPLSEIAELASALAPRPAKPVIVAPAPVAPSAQVMNVPVESAFNSGGVNKTVRTDVAIAAAAAQPEAGGWKPTAGRALAALVKDEIDALAKPTPIKADAAEAIPVRGLLDLPAAEAAVTQNARATGNAQRQAEPQAPEPMQQSYVAQAPAYSAYVPPAPAKQSNMNGLLVGILALFVLVVAGSLVFFVVKSSQAPQPAPQPQIVYALPPPQAQVPAAAAAKTPAPAAVAAAPAAAAPLTVADPRNIQAPNSGEIRGLNSGGGSRGGGRVGRRGGDKNPAAPAGGEQVAAADTGHGEVGTSKATDDDFDSAFGGGSKTSETKKAKPSVYVPPAPGSATGLPDTLEKSDIMSTVLAHKPDIINCVNQQKAKNPGSSGKLMMHWNVAGSGRTNGVGLGEASSDLAGSPIATCMTKLISGWTFPKSQKGSGEQITFPFTY